MIISDLEFPKYHANAPGVPLMFSAVVRVDFDFPETDGPSFGYCMAYAFSEGVGPQYVAPPAISDFAAILGDAITGILSPLRGKHNDCVFDGWRFCSADQFLCGFDCIRCPIDLNGQESILRGRFMGIDTIT